MFNWTRPETKCLHNLHALTRDGVEVGFVHKPRDTKTDKSAFRCHKGIGDAAEFLGHRWNLRDAKQLVSDSI